jgi:methylphosphotriester-DNA--protein-cysteine methyltransferase
LGFIRRVHVFGIRFKPEGLFPIFAVPAAEILSRFADVEMLVKRDFGDFCHRIKDAHSTGERISLAESFLLKKIGNKLGTPHYLHFASEIIRQRNGQISLQELAGEVFISPRQLEREFKQKIGISPKQYMRIARLNSVQKMINETTSKQDFSGISYDAGYADQAHFIRDFKYFTGKSPRRFIENRKHFIVNIQ